MAEPITASTEVPSSGQRTQGPSARRPLVVVNDDQPGVSGRVPDDDLDEAREICLRQLHSRGHTRGELSAILRRKGIADDVAQAALDRLVEVGLIDDLRLARDWIERHGVGKAAWVLQRELVQKGIDPAAVRRLLDEIPAPDGAELAVVARRWPSLRRLPEPTQIRRAAGLLARRGFDPACAATLIAQLRTEDGSDDAAGPPILDR